MGGSAGTFHGAVSKAMVIDWLAVASFEAVARQCPRPYNNDVLRLLNSIGRRSGFPTCLRKCSYTPLATY